MCLLATICLRAALTPLQIDPSLAPAFLAVREEYGLPESKALVERGLRDQAAKSLEVSRKRRGDQQPPAYVEGEAGSSSTNGAPAANGSAPPGDSVARLLEQLRLAEGARRAAEDERRKAMDMYLASEGERARLEAELQSCKCRR